MQKQIKQQIIDWFGDNEKITIEEIIEFVSESESFFGFRLQPLLKDNEYTVWAYLLKEKHDVWYGVIFDFDCFSEIKKYTQNELSEELAMLKERVHKLQA